MQGRNCAVPPSLEKRFSLSSCAERGTSVNSRPVIRIICFDRFAPSTGSLNKITCSTSDPSTFKISNILVVYFIIRSEERRVGKECRSRRRCYHVKNKEQSTM